MSSQCTQSYILALSKVFQFSVFDNCILYFCFICLSLINFNRSIYIHKKYLSFFLITIIDLTELFIYCYKNVGIPL